MKTINLVPDLVQYKNKRGLCVSGKGIKNVGKMKVPGFFQKRSCEKNTLDALAPLNFKFIT